MRTSEKVKLLAGPYRPPAVRVGDVTSCHYWNRDVVITGWSEGRISWPMCKPREGYGRPRILVDHELARAIQTESAEALKHWFGVSVKQVWRWRQCFSIGRTDTPGSARLVQAAAQLGADAVKAKDWTEEELERKRQIAEEHHLGQHLTPGYNLGPWWKPEEIALLGTMPDDDVAERIGRTVGAVRHMRTKRGIANARDRRRRK
jgi:hypothetical protein